MHNIKARIAGSPIGQGFSPQGSDVSLLLWNGLYVEIAAFDAIAPYHPTANAILVPIHKRLQNHSHLSTYWKMDEIFIKSHAHTEV